MLQVEFTHNYNGKLFLDYFGSVQLYDSNRFFIGNTLSGVYRGKEMGIMRVEAIRSFRYKHISDVLSFLECGNPAHYLAELMRKMAEAEGFVIQPHTRLDHVIFSYEKRNIETQTLLLQEWWQARKQNQDKL